MSWRPITAGALFACLLPFACTGNEDQGGPADPPAPDASSPDATLPDARDEDRMNTIIPGQCSAGGFCYVSLSTKLPLKAVTATTIDDAWAAGDKVLLRWADGSWQTAYEYAGSSSEFRSVGLRMTKEADLWALFQDDDKHAVFVRGSTASGSVSFREIATEESIGAPLVMWITSTWLSPAPAAFWASMFNGTVLRFREDGGRIATDRFIPTRGPGDPSTFQWTSIWGFGPDDIYVGGTRCGPAFPGTPSDFCSPTQSALAHYDGTAFSIALLDTGTSIESLFGTPPGQPRELWITEEIADISPTRTERVPVLGDGTLGAPLFTESLTTSRQGSRVMGSVATPSAAWISNGGHVWRWNGLALETTATSINEMPVGVVNSLWGGSIDDAWIVGQAVAQGPGFPPTGFAARHSKDGKGGQP